jgi:hypothetical protein
LTEPRYFLPQATLDRWVHDQRIELGPDQLVLREEGRRYRIVEGVRVIGEVTGALDLHELTGKVKTVAHVRELGAELLDTSMLIGDLAYEVVPGWIATPDRSFSEYLESPARALALRALGRSGDLVVVERPHDDDDLLARMVQG